MKRESWVESDHQVLCIRREREMQREVRSGNIGENKTEKLTGVTRKTSETDKLNDKRE